MRALTIAALATMTGCYHGSSPTADDGADAADDGGSGSAGDGADGSGGVSSCMPDAIGPAYLRQLTAVEYRNSIAVLFGADLPDPTAAFPQAAIVGGYDNNAEAFAISDLHVERWRDAAESVATAVVADADRRSALLGCDPVGAERDACIEAFIRTFGRRTWRRTLGDDEVDDLRAVAAAADGDDDPWVGPRLVIEALLQSPNFLFRIEVGDPDPQVPARRELRGHEIATRLSFLILAATPSDALLDAAEDGALADADGIEAVARELLTDPAARAGLRNFHRQWLQLPVLEHVQRDPARYPQWSDELRAAMLEETQRFVDDFALDASADFLDVLTDRRGYVDAALAELYGVAAPEQGFAAIEFAPADRRGGLLTQASVLALTGKNEPGLAIFRGKFVREVLRCETLPPPPPDVPAIPEPIDGESDRERLQRHRSDPACAGCHAVLDPVGFALAEYDAIGARRTVDSAGAPIDARGSLGGDATTEFDGPFELAALLHDDPLVARCIVQQTFRYTFGRRELEADVCAIDEAAAAFADGGHALPELLIAFVRSDAFRYRNAEEGP